MKQGVIFLIDSHFFDRDIVSITLEKFTQCRVFCFFSFEESLLYKNLEPSVIIHDRNEKVDTSKIGNNIKDHIVTNQMINVNSESKAEIALNIALSVKNMLEK